MRNWEIFVCWRGRLFNVFGHAAEMKETEFVDEAAQLINPAHTAAV